MTSSFFNYITYIGWLRVSMNTDPRIYHDFEGAVRTGSIAEDIIRTQLQQILAPAYTPIIMSRLQAVKAYMYGQSHDDTSAQLHGIDGQLTIHPITFDVKARDRKYYQNHDILLETKSDITRNTKGWFETSMADVIVYTWWANSKRNEIYDAVLLLLPIIRPVLLPILNLFPIKIAHSTRDGSTWETENVAVQFLRFPPDGFIWVDPTKIFKHYADVPPPFRPMYERWLINPHV